MIFIYYCRELKDEYFPVDPISKEPSIIFKLNSKDLEKLREMIIFPKRLRSRPLCFLGRTAL